MICLNGGDNTVIISLSVKESIVDGKNPFLGLCIITPMQYRNMGKYGIKLSVISLGGWLTLGSWLDDYLGKRVMETAVEQGINFFDVADMYAKGSAEQALGEFLKDYERSDFVVSTKVFFPMSENPNNKGLSRKHIMESVNKSLQRLQMDYIDIYFCHRFDYRTPLEETILTMTDLVEQGKILYWGTSNWYAAEIERAYGIARALGAIPPAVEQPRYNLLDRYIELYLWGTGTVDYTGIGVVPWSPLAQGVLTGKYIDGIPADSRHKTMNKLPERDLKPEVQGKLKQLREIAHELDITLSQLSLSWALSRSWVSSLITGASKPEQVKENTKAAEINLSKDIIKKIEEIMDNEPKHHPSWWNNYRAYKTGKLK